MTTNLSQLFLLLQVNDAGFPIGGYTHSYGLETYIQRGAVHDARSAGHYIECNLQASFLYSELLPASLAYDYAGYDGIAALLDLEQSLAASRTPRELREAANKLGVRFCKTAGPLLDADTVFSAYTRAAGRLATHAVAYGVFCAAAGIDKREAAAAYLYAQTAAMVTVAVKSVPLAQSDGQALLAGLHGLFARLLEQLEGLGADDLCRSTPGLDIAAMQHEHLYTRLYIS
jgi:urease accessory protein